MSARNARSGPRIAILGFYLESNAFAPVTTAADFHANCYLEGDDILIEAAKNAPAMPSEIPGFIKGMNATGAWQPLPIVVAAAHPGGRVDQAFFETTMTRMNRLLAAAQPVDAVYIFSHGAMVATETLDPDGALYRMVRTAVGPDVPVIATVDLHANVSDEMVAASDVIVSYRTNPHVDQAERAAEAAGLLRRLLDGSKLDKHHIRMPISAPTVTLLTAQGPYADLVKAGQAARGEDLPVVSVVAGFPYGDTPYDGLTVLAYGTGDRPGQVARDLAQQAWADRERFRPRLTPLDEAIARAAAAAADPDLPAVCLADVADNPGGGGRGNTGDILRALVARHVPQVLFGVFIDPALAQTCHERGEGAEFEARFAATGADDAPDPIVLPVRVLRLSDGSIVGRKGFYEGRTVRLGPSAALQTEGITVVVASGRAQTADPAFFEAFGLDIARFRTVVVKSRGHFRAGFAEFFKPNQIVEVDANGLTSPMLSRFAYRNLRRPIYPLDPDTTWDPPTG